MKIIVESGATKSDWRIVPSDGSGTRQILSDGMNVSTMPMESVIRNIAEVADKITACCKDRITGIYMYTAGVLTPEISSGLVTALKSISATAEIDVQTDLTGAARAVCGNRPGIAAILGTGSNSCSYDGKEITGRVYSCGYILGDEGSAAALGKMFMADYLKGLVPEEIAKEFAGTFPCDYATVVENVYRSKTSPSGYLGSFAPFIIERYQHPYIRNMVDANFRSFIDRSLRQYDIDGLPVGVVGGFGYACRDIFARIAAESGIRIARFLPRPIDGLVEYHTSSLSRI